MKPWKPDVPCGRDRLLALGQAFPCGGLEMPGGVCKREQTFSPLGFQGLRQHGPSRAVYFQSLKLSPPERPFLCAGSRVCPQGTVEICSWVELDQAQIPIQVYEVPEASDLILAAAEKVRVLKGGNRKCSRDVLRCIAYLGVSRVFGSLNLGLQSFLPSDWVSPFFACLSNRSFNQ